MRKEEKTKKKKKEHKRKHREVSPEGNLESKSRRVHQKDLLASLDV